jgi:hypothetical protein
MYEHRCREVHPHPFIMNPSISLRMNLETMDKEGITVGSSRENDVFADIAASGMSLLGKGLTGGSELRKTS